MPRTSRLTTLAAMAICSALAHVRVSAEDAVFLKPSANSRTSTRITGTITDYTGRELLIRTASGREQMIPAERVDEVVTTYSQKQTDADLLVEKRRFADAEALYRQAVADEARQWVRRMLLAQIVRCLTYQEKYEEAGGVFLLIVKNDPATQYFDAIPLAWGRIELPLLAERRAIEWLRKTDDPVAQLIAASWLLSGPAELRAEAQQVIDALTRSSNAKVAQLAVQQQWRTRIVLANEQEIARWQSILDKIDPALRAGGYFIIGQTLARLGRHEDAALALMRVPVLYRQQRELSAESLLATAESLEKNDQADQARNCLRELLRDHPDSTAAAAAKRKLESATGG